MKTFQIYSTFKYGNKLKVFDQFIQFKKKLILIINQFNQAFKKMISLLKNVPLSICLLHKLSFRIANTSNVEFHKAVLASNIITTITQSPFNSYRSESFPSLYERILEIIDTYQNKNTDKEQNLVKKAAEEVRNCFKGGVYVPSYMCNQSRNSQYEKNFQQVKKQGVNIEVLNLKEVDSASFPTFKKLIFCPTYVTTGQIFRKILEHEKYKYLTGQYGIGKTYSFILYTLLSEMIFRYRHQNCSGQDDLPKEINFDILKAVYISVNLNSSDLNQKQSGENRQRKIIQQILKWHCYQFKELYKDKEGIMQSFRELNVKYLNRYGVSLILLNDQINALAAAFRQFKFVREFLDQLDKKIKILRKKSQNQGFQNDQDIKNLKMDIQKASDEYEQAGLMLKKAQKFIGALNKMISAQIFGSLFYLSSVDIEQYLLKNLKLMGDSNQMDISSLKCRLNYPITLYGDISIADTCQMIVLHLRSSWQKNWMKENKTGQEKLPNQQEAMLGKIKKLLNVVMRKQSFVFVLPLKISQYFRKKIGIQQSLNQQQNSNDDTLILSYQKSISLKETQLQEILNLLMEKLQQLSVQEMVKKFTEFLEKKTGIEQIDSIKPILCFRLWNKAEHILKNPEIYGSGQIKITGFENLFINPQLNSVIPYQLFSFQTNKLVTHLNPLVIRKVFDAKRNIYYQQLLKSKNLLLDYSQGNRSVLGTFLESCLIKMLKYGGTNFEIIKNVKDGEIIQFSKIHSITSCFKPMLKTNMIGYSDFQFLESFEAHLQTISKQNADLVRKAAWCLLLPLEKSYHQKMGSIIQSGIKYNQVDRLSRLIDFALCKINLRGNIIYIQAFDVTTRISSFTEKIQEFLVEFLNFADKEKTFIKIDNEKYKVQLYYNVISTQIFDNDFEKYFSNRIRSLESYTKPSDDIKKKLHAFKSFTFTNKKGNCFIQGVESNVFLKQIRVISLVTDHVKITNQDPTKKIELDQTMFRRVMEQLKRVIPK